MKNTPLTSGSKKGIFGGQYDVVVTPYEGFDFSRRCFVFPGQSAAFAGMMRDEFGTSTSARLILAQADELAATYGLPPIADFIFAPERLSLEDLVRLRNPALFTAEYAIFKHLASKGLHPTVVTGHSFGDYASLAAAEIATFANVFKLVVMRDQFSPPAKSVGMMIVANAPVVTVEKCLAGFEYFISNINSPQQVVISTRPADELSVLSALKASRIAAKTLHEMTQPFHTPWMREVAQNMRAFIDSEKIAFSPPKIPLISALGAELINAENFARKNQILPMSERIARQVCEPVNFPQQILQAIACQAIHFTEVGPGNICSQFIKSCLGEALFKVSPVQRFFEGIDRPRSVRQSSLSREKSGLLNSLNKVIAAVTGYNVDEISVHDNFQEDLGIDSIRKAEIVFKFMELNARSSRTSGALHIDLSQLKRIEDVIEHFDNAPTTAAARQQAPARFGRYQEFWQKLELSALEQIGKSQDFKTFRVIDLAQPALADLEWLRSRPSDVTIAFWAGTSLPNVLVTDVAQDFTTKLMPWIATFRAIAQAGERWNVRLALVRGPKSDPYFCGLDGFFKSWLREKGFEAYKSIEWLEPFSAERLAMRVQEEFLDPCFVDVRFSQDTRFTKCWRLQSVAQSRDLGAHPVIVSLGGGRGIGAAILEKVATDSPGASIYVLGRSPDTEPRVSATLSRLRELCPNIHYRQADVTNADRLGEICHEVVQAHGRIDVLLNGAGVEMSRSLATKCDPDIYSEFAAKVAPATTIAKLSHALPIARIVNYSSIAATFGNTGQTIYALGNQIQMGLGEHFAASAQTRLTTLILPPWDDLGMTENPLILKGLKANGVALLPPAQGAQLVLEEIRNLRGECVAFLDANDIRAYDCDITARTAHASLFSRPISTGAPLRLVHLNRRAQPYLNDHLINGNIIYPGSSALALMFYVGYHYFKRPPIIENFAVRSFLAPEAEDSNCMLEVERVEKGHLRLQISSRNIVHFVAEVVDCGQPPAFATFAPYSAVGRKECEPIYNSNHISFGESFQLAHGLWLNDQNEVMQMSQDSKLCRYTGSVLFDRLQQWFESALQLMGGQLVWQTKRYWVPNRIARVTMAPNLELTDRLFYRVVISEQDTDLAVANAQATNDRGQVILQLQGIEDIQIGQAAESGFKIKTTAAPNSNASDAQGAI